MFAKLCISMLASISVSSASSLENVRVAPVPDALAPTAFTHPGVFVSIPQLEFVKANIHSPPWSEALARVLSDDRASKNYQPRPFAHVECGSFSNPNNGCTEETVDSQAAYTQAILYLLTGEAVYGDNAVKILNAWANTLEGHSASNAPLQASWSAVMFTRAAELLRHSYASWPKEDVNKVQNMLTSRYVPTIEKVFDARGGYGCFNMNWHATATEALAGIAVFSNNNTLFERAVSHWGHLIQAYIYLPSDGNRPKNAPWCPRNDGQISGYWQKPYAYVEGLAQESCRDFDHTAYGLSSIINVAETARLQGLDLYDDEATQSRQRITQALELHSGYQNGSRTQKLCAHPDYAKRLFKGGTVGAFEVGFNHYAMREDTPLPETEIFLNNTRPTEGVFHYLWETLTHGLTGNL